MKKLFFLPSFIIAIVSLLTLASCEAEKTLAPNEIPSQIQNFVTNHFPDHTILQTIQERDGLGKKYDVLLSENYKLEFNGKKEIISMEGILQLPNSTINSKILDYVNQNYPGSYIIDWELDGKRQKIELNNGLSLEFNSKNEFVKFD